MATDAASGASPAAWRRVDNRVNYVSRWLYTWIALLVVAALAVVVFLILIAHALHGVRENVTTASDQVQAVRANTSILPGQVATINDHLTAVDNNLSTIPNQLSAVNSALGAVNGTLQHTGGALGDTSDVLRGTTGSLTTTDARLGDVAGSLSGTDSALGAIGTSLASVRSLAGDINQTLIATDRSPNKLDDQPVPAGATGIFLRVAIANGELAGVRSDAGDILAGLDSIERHLTSTCRALIPQTLGAVPDPGKPLPSGTPC